MFRTESIADPPLPHNPALGQYRTFRSARAGRSRAVQLLGSHTLSCSRAHLACAATASLSMSVTIVLATSANVPWLWLGVGRGGVAPTRSQFGSYEGRRMSVPDIA
eukprot:884612-Rhodomonas_salina.1